MFDFLVYSIYDRVSGSFGELFLCKKDELAVRKFDYLMSNSPMVQADCELYQLGNYDTDSGSLVGFDKPKFIKKFEVK